MLLVLFVVRSRRFEGEIIEKGGPYFLDRQLKIRP